MATGEFMSALFVELCGSTNVACLWSASVQLRGRCTLDHFCDGCDEFLPSDLGCSFIPPPQCKIRSLWYLVSYFSYLTPPLFLFLFLREEEQLCSAFLLCFGPILLSCFMVLDLELPQHSPLAPGAMRLMRKAKQLQVKGSGLCCGEKLGKIHHQGH